MSCIVALLTEVNEPGSDDTVSTEVITVSFRKVNLQYNFYFSEDVPQSFKSH